MSCIARILNRPIDLHGLGLAEVSSRVREPSVGAPLFPEEVEHLDVVLIWIAQH